MRLNMRILIVLICVITFGYQKNELNGADKKSELSTDKLLKFYKIQKNMTSKEIFAIIGRKPSYVAGSGISYDVYVISADVSVWIAWVKGKTAWAFVKTKIEGEKDAVKPLFE